MSNPAKMIAIGIAGLVIGGVAMKAWTAWQWTRATSCEALLYQQNLPNPFHLVGTDCAVMDVSKGYRADEPTEFAPESTVIWRDRLVKVLGRKGNAIVVQDCPKCVPAWIGSGPDGRPAVKRAPEVPN